MLTTLPDEPAGQDAGGTIEPTAQQELPEYRVGPGDVLEVAILGFDEFSQTVQVSNSGKIHVAHLGVVAVTDLTGAEIERTITLLLQEKQLFKDPWVRVHITEYNSQPVFVVGEVHAPGQFVISREMYLLDAVSRAGGFTPMAGSEGFLLRRQYRPRVSIDVDFEFHGEIGSRAGVLDRLASTVKQSSGWEASGREGPTGALDSVKEITGETIRIAINDLQQGLRPDLNFRLQGGDVFFVPRRKLEYIYIVGEVPFPGAYTLPREYDHITAARAVSYAGGPLRTASAGSAFIMRRDENGSVQGLPFDFGEIIQGKRPDIPTMPNDIIFVPRSLGRTVGYRMLDMAALLTWQLVVFF